MRNAPARFLNAAFWPFTIWASLTHLEEHPADDYVERTSPIVAFALAFWICLGAIAGLWATLRRSLIVAAGDEESVLRFMNPALMPMLNVLLFFLPAIYAVGFWMFTARDERFPR
ncbi:MAG: hypothetical protein JNJ73_17175 [Hyphomonadaceae bacterium]|nr:hypothetical protein [Hyphomonadaceae bacterium]